ncbi:hypothetical protein PFICI_06747 [Pestalotiopsis fici W106-1]|uniref:Uncharacterized protein n=1 Tax=Pestalotiopsis fici (strain W106-1 / CGMCC3.15140) TaxID=1229662 RepID=W3X6S6_PESFW|nr:uncharacterized protein PFICI_06747 [Pestalotiopsis fici W106-1]ETS81745.1 hypothetical protein PFICI_06747 [Pestalotiopsis fici W106-1]
MNGGFVVALTATASGAQRKAALERLRAVLLSSRDSDAEFHPSTLALPAVDLPVADYGAARAAVRGWISAYDKEDEWEPGVRRDVFVVVHAPALDSLLTDDRPLG